MLWLYFTIGLLVSFIDTLRFKTVKDVSELEYDLPFSVYLLWSLFVASVWPLSVVIFIISAAFSNKSNIS